MELEDFRKIRVSSPGALLKNLETINDALIYVPVGGPREKVDKAITDLVTDIHRDIQAMVTFSNDQSLAIRSLARELSIAGDEYEDCENQLLEVEATTTLFKEIIDFARQLEDGPDWPIDSSETAMWKDSIMGLIDSALRYPEPEPEDDEDEL